MQMTSSTSLPSGARTRIERTELMFRYLRGDRRYRPIVIILSSMLFWRISRVEECLGFLHTHRIHIIYLPNGARGVNDDGGRVKNIAIAVRDIPGRGEDMVRCVSQGSHCTGFTRVSVDDTCIRGGMQVSGRSLSWVSATPMCRLSQTALGCRYLLSSPSLKLIQRSK